MKIARMELMGGIDRSDVNINIVELIETSQAIYIRLCRTVSHGSFCRMTRG